MSAIKAKQAAPAAPSVTALTVRLAEDRPMRLDSGAFLGPIDIAYTVAGALNAERSNAILVCHALTGDQYVVGTHAVTGKPGWWEAMVGPGRPIDTDRYFVICANVVGGCMGTTGPMSDDPATGAPYALAFPVITIGDMVRAQRLLIDHLGIERLFAVIGGSMGAMQVLAWATAYPERIAAAIPIAGAPRHSAQNIAFHEVGRQAIMADPDWAQGAYRAQGRNPRAGLAVARMAAHITYLSEAALHRKFGRNLQDRARITYGFEADFQVESYLRHQGSTFVDRFDANSYLYITRAMDYFDLAAEHGGQLAQAFRGTEVAFCVVAFSSDWLFPPAESRALAHAINAAGGAVSFVEIETDKGHDAFLLDEPELHRVVAGFLEGTATRLHIGEPFEPAAAAPPALRKDLKLIADLIEPGARVLDVGCGDGELLAHLVAEKGVAGRGLELSPEGVSAALARGVAVIQGDANVDLKEFPDGAFDYAVLSRTLQAMQDPRAVLAELTRISRRAIVAIENFGHWRGRLGLLTHGELPVDAAKPWRWWESPNIHPCTIFDFMALVDEVGLMVEQTLTMTAGGRTARRATPRRLDNVLATEATFVLSRR